MKIEEIVFEFTETKTYTLVVSSVNGWDMPETGNRLVELVNEIKNQPHKFINDDSVSVNSSSVECDHSEIIEAK